MTSTPGSYGGASSASEPTAPGADTSIGEMLANVSRDISTLMRQEVELAKAEAKQSATKAGKGAGMFGGAGVAALLMLIFLSLALMWLLGDGLLHLGLGWGAFIVGLIWALVAAILAVRGKKEISAVGMPKTADTAKRIPDALMGNEHTDKEIR